MISCISQGISSFRHLAIRPVAIQSIKLIYTSPVNAAARKGTREKARKKKVKVEVKKLGFIPENQRGRNKYFFKSEEISFIHQNKILNFRLNLLRQDKHIDDSWKSVSTDNVWVGRYCRWPVYTVAEAIECHRETHHPSMYNEPNAPLNVAIELNMQGEKITRFVDKFQRTVTIPHPFDQKIERNILVFGKGEV